MSRLFTKAQRRELYRRAEGRCECTGPRYGLPEGVRCMNMLGSTWEAHHELASAQGGETTIENGIAACVPCHRYSTAKHDVPQIAKNVRVAEKVAGIRRTRSSFATNRDGRWKKRMDGSVVER